MINGFLKIASVTPLHRVADVDFNVGEIMSALEFLDARGVEIAVFPELAVTGYTCADLFHNETLLRKASDGLERIRQLSASLSVHAFVGVPRLHGGSLRNSAAFVHDGVVDFVDKTYLPNYNEFYEKRWFESADAPAAVFESHGVPVGVEICEDLWAPVPPSCGLAMRGALVVFNLSASDDVIGKHAYLMSLVRQQSARCLCAYAYSSAGFGESTTDLVFLPKNIICENGKMLAENNREDYLNASCVIADIDISAIVRERMHNTTFADSARRSGCDVLQMSVNAGAVDVHRLPMDREVGRYPFVPPSDDLIDARCKEIVTIQECGLVSRLKAIGCPKVVVGISGGLDSTLALLIAVKAMRRLDRPVSDIVAVTMPGFGTTDRTYDNAMTLMRELGVTIREISIADAVRGHFEDIGHNPESRDVTYENSQARERTQILMDLSNEVGGIVLGTGDLSELALGWATYNGDHMSMYGVNAGVPKTLVRYVVRHFALSAEDVTLKDVLLDIIDTPISPELIPADADGNIAQKTESLVGPYDLNDFFLFYMLRFGFSPSRIVVLAKKAFGDEYDEAAILFWLERFYRRFFTQQFKRSCLPDGPKVGSVCLSPRGDWRMPSDASYALWLKEVESLNAECR